MDTLIKIWEPTFLKPLAILISLLCIIIFFGPSNRQSNIPLSIKLYLIAFFVGFTSNDLVVLWNNNYSESTRLICIYIDFVLTIIEFILLMYFFYSINKKNSQKKILLFLSIVFSIVTVFLFIFMQFGSTYRQHAVVWLYTIQVCFLLIPVFFYFQHLFSTKTVGDVSGVPTFWIASGIAFFAFCTVMLSIVETFFLYDKPVLLGKLYPIYYLFYVLMFLFFLIAHLCNKATFK